MKYKQLNCLMRWEQRARGLFTLMLLLLAVSSGVAQQQVLNNIQAVFQNYHGKQVQEKIYVHTNKSFYLAGEILWLKIYCVDASLHRPLDLSKIAYVEVVSKDLKPVLQAKISMKAGIGKGSFFLPLSFGSGNYKLRAYTNWMKNFGPEVFFEKDITIINTFKKLGTEPVVSKPKYDIQFFPEGGNLVNGIESKVAFKVTNQEGKGVDCSGMVLSSSGQTMADFHSLKFGMGDFLFTPSPDSSYHAMIKIGNQEWIPAEFSKALPSGYTLGVTEKDSLHLMVTVKTNVDMESPFVNLLVHTRGMVKAAELLLVKKGEAHFILDKEKLGDGISQITLFDGNGKPVCERLYFKKPSRKLNIRMNSDRDEYGLRRKVALHIGAEDEKGLPVKANLSLSVFREDSLPSLTGTDISSYFFLNADLKGTIEEPDYYFQHQGSEIDHETDVLMLTHGWRRFKREDLLNSAPKPAYEFLPEYEGHIITGKITDKKNGWPVENINSFLTVPGDQFELGTSVSNREGKILFNIKDFYGHNELILQTNTANDSNYRIDINTPFSEKYSDGKFPELILPKPLAGELLNQSIHMQVENAYASDKLQRFLPPAGAKDTTAFYGKPDAKYFLDDYTRFTSMEEVMRELVKNILVKNQHGTFHIDAMDFVSDRFFKGDPLVLLDGLPIFDLNKLFAFDPLKVKKIELMNRNFYHGPLSSNGILSYTTYKGDLGGFPLDPSAVILEYDGLQLEREFYAPVYDLPVQSVNRVPDGRTSLLWAPEIITATDGKKELSFYTSDIPGRYKLCILGVTADGRAGSQTIEFEVTK